MPGINFDSFIKAASHFEAGDKLFVTGNRVLGREASVKMGDRFVSWLSSSSRDKANDQSAFQRALNARHGPVIGEKAYQTALQ